MHSWIHIYSAISGEAYSNAHWGKYSTTLYTFWKLKQTLAFQILWLHTLMLLTIEPSGCFWNPLMFCMFLMAYSNPVSLLTQ